MAVKYWLMKTEPTTYSIDDLAKEKNKTTCWEGVRNYQARNLLRDEIKLGDRVLFYHSACKEPAVVGTAVVVRPGYPDKFAFDRKSKYYDAKSDADYPTWYMVDIKLDKKFAKPVTLAELKKRAALKEMVLLQKGSRLSVQPVKKSEFNAVLKWPRPVEFGSEIRHSVLAAHQARAVRCGVRPQPRCFQRKLKCRMRYDQHFGRRS